MDIKEIVRNSAKYKLKEFYSPNKNKSIEEYEQMSPYNSSRAEKEEFVLNNYKKAFGKDLYISDGNEEKELSDLSDDVIDSLVTDIEDSLDIELNEHHLEDRETKINFIKSQLGNAKFNLDQLSNEEVDNLYRSIENGLSITEDQGPTWDDDDTYWGGKTSYWNDDNLYYADDEHYWGTGPDKSMWENLTKEDKRNMLEYVLENDDMCGCLDEMFANDYETLKQLKVYGRMGGDNAQKMAMTKQMKEDEDEEEEIVLTDMINKIKSEQTDCANKLREELANLVKEREQLNEMLGEPDYKPAWNVHSGVRYDNEYNERKHIKKAMNKVSKSQETNDQKIYRIKKKQLFGNKEADKEEVNENRLKFSSILKEAEDKPEGLKKTEKVQSDSEGYNSDYYKEVDKKIDDFQQLDNQDENEESVKKYEFEDEQSDEVDVWRGYDNSDLEYDVEPDQKYKDRVEREIKTGDSVERDESKVGEKANVGHGKVYGPGESTAGEDKYKTAKKRADAKENMPFYNKESQPTEKDNEEEYDDEEYYALNEDTKRIMDLMNVDTSSKYRRNHHSKKNIQEDFDKTFNEFRTMKQNDWEKKRSTIKEAARDYKVSIDFDNNVININNKQINGYNANIALKEADKLAAKYDLSDEEGVVAFLINDKK